MKNLDTAIISLEKMTHKHAFWDCDLLYCFANRRLNADQIRLVFSQHYLYAKNFTKLLAILMSRLNNPAHRAAIVDNLWEEAGDGNPNNSHANLLNAFLDDLGVNREAEDEEFKNFTIHYVDACLTYIKSCKPVQACAFLAWATESIVPRLYSIFIENFKSLGMPEDMYRFFSLHIECDDGHAEVLANIAADYAEEYPTIEMWKKDCWDAIDYALTLRRDFFDQIYEQITLSHITPICNEISSSHSHKNAINGRNLVDNLTTATTLYENTNQDVSFKVQRFNIDSSVIDPRFLTLPPKARNEHHRHAHESVFFVVSGKGKVIVGDKEIPVSANASVYVPRWIPHHTENTGNEPLCIFAVTDFGLTKHFPGNTETSYREKNKNLDVVA